MIDKKGKKVLAPAHDKRTALTDKVIAMYRNRSLDLVEEKYTWLKDYKKIKSIYESVGDNDSRDQMKYNEEFHQDKIQGLIDFYNKNKEIYTKGQFGNDIKLKE